MKRLILAAALMFLLIGFNFFCLNLLHETKDDISKRLDFIEYSIKSDNFEETASECEKFEEYWLIKQHLLSRIVRRELLEQMACSVAKFAPLAEFEEYGELCSEINLCRIVIEEIYDSELPLFRNIF